MTADDPRFARIYKDAKYAKTFRRNVTTGEEEVEARLDDAITTEKEDFQWDEASTSSSECAEEACLEDIEELKEQMAVEDVPVTHTEQSSRRLAIMGLDWANIKAQDIYILCHTTSSSGSGGIESVAVYLSDIGAVAVEREKVEGPDFKELELIQRKVEELNSFGGELTEATALALRQYEKKRSQYYYAIVNCASKEVAEELYETLDGMEADFAVDGIDVRYVPDSLTEFPRSPESTCDHLPAKYDAPVAFDSAIKHTRPELHWDEPDLKRKKILTKRFTDAEMNALDLEDYFAGEDDDEGGHASDEDKERIAKIRSLLLGDAAKNAADSSAATGKEIEPIEGSFLVTEDGNVTQVEDKPEEDGAADKPRRKKKSGFSLLLNASAEDNSASSDDEEELVDLSLKDPDFAEENSSSDEQHKPSSKRTKFKAKMKAAKTQRKQKQREDLDQKAVMSEVKEDKRFQRLFTDPKHFVDCTEKRRRRH